MGSLVVASGSFILKLRIYLIVFNIRGSVYHYVEHRVDTLHFPFVCSEQIRLIFGHGLVYAHATLFSTCLWIFLL